MAKSSEAERIAQLEHEVGELRRQLALVVAFLDVETRERQGLTSDQIRAALREASRN
jgi:hypothetical protein